jgi:hypothetical protein
MCPTFVESIKIIPATSLESGTETSADTSAKPWWSCLALLLGLKLSQTFPHNAWRLIWLIWLPRQPLPAALGQQQPWQQQQQQHRTTCSVTVSVNSTISCW